MPRRATSIRTTRAIKRKHARNLKVKQQMKKVMKKYQALLTANNVAEAKKFIATVCSSLDKAAKKRVIHPKTANRKKSRLMRRLAKTA
jgi:small subunit ribosomal protein S20